jgi:hypothetical protein
MRFENLSADFENALSRIGIEPVRPLPVANKTAGRSRDFWSYFDDSIRGRAVWVSGPYFERWGYEFPEDWDAHVPAASRVTLGAVNGPRKLYWRYLR